MGKDFKFRHSVCRINTSDLLKSRSERSSENEVTGVSRDDGRNVLDGILVNRVQDFTIFEERT